MWETWSSMWRNEASSGLRRSGHIDPPFGVPPLDARYYRRVFGSPGVSRRVAAGERAPQGGECGRRQNPPARFLVGRLDHPGAPVLRHGAQAHGPARGGPRAPGRSPRSRPSPSRAISRSMRRCTVRRIQPSAPLALPWAADMEEMTTTTSSPSDRSTSAFVDGVHAAVDVLGAADVHRPEVAGDGARRQHGLGQPGRWCARRGRTRPVPRRCGGRCRCAGRSGQRLPMCSSRPRAAFGDVDAPPRQERHGGDVGPEGQGAPEGPRDEGGGRQGPGPEQGTDGRRRERLRRRRGGCAAGWRRPAARWETP